MEKVGKKNRTLMCKGWSDVTMGFSRMWGLKGQWINGKANWIKWKKIMTKMKTGKATYCVSGEVKIKRPRATWEKMAV